MTTEKINALAKRFAEKVRATLTPGELMAVIDLNRNGDQSVCHTHDFVDANELMVEAYSEVIGCEFELTSDVCALINAAWDEAKGSHFFTENL